MTRAARATFTPRNGVPRSRVSRPRLSLLSVIYARVFVGSGRRFGPCRRFMIDVCANVQSSERRVDILSCTTWVASSSAGDLLRVAAGSNRRRGA